MRRPLWRSSAVCLNGDNERDGPEAVGLFWIIGTQKRIHLILAQRSHFETADVDFLVDNQSQRRGTVSIAP
jgi:hypothetical protein